MQLPAIAPSSQNPLNKSDSIAEAHIHTFTIWTERMMCWIMYSLLNDVRILEAGALGSAYVFSDTASTPKSDTLYRYPYVS